MTSVENYLKAFKRVVFLRVEKKFTDHEISVAAGISQRAVKVYLEVYESFKNKSITTYRMDEICHVGNQYYKQTGEKKDSQLVNTSKAAWRVK
jgi:DNA-binding Xre family transcriptional regulator